MLPHSARRDCIRRYHAGTRKRLNISATLSGPLIRKLLLAPLKIKESQARFETNKKKVPSLGGDCHTVFECGGGRWLWFHIIRKSARESDFWYHLLGGPRVFFLLVSTSIHLHRRTGPQRLVLREWLVAGATYVVVSKLVVSAKYTAENAPNILWRFFDAPEGTCPPTGCGSIVD